MKQTCSIEGCDKPINRWLYKGWCPMHYTRWRRHGDPNETLKVRGGITEEQFWGYVNTRDPDECWDWTRGKDQAGYGIVLLNGRRDRTHRIAWSLTRGDIPAGLFVCHHCDRPSCCNPNHLFLGSNSENIEDARRKGRMSLPPVNRGEDHYNTNMTNELVMAARLKYATGKYTLRDIANEYKTSISMVHALVRGKTWKHLPLVE